MKTENSESLSYCPGAQDMIDLSKFEEDEQLYSAEYNTYCVIYFCGKHLDCEICRQLKNKKTLK